MRSGHPCFAGIGSSTNCGMAHIPATIYSTGTVQNTNVTVSNAVSYSWTNAVAGEVVFYGPTHRQRRLRERVSP
jgi:hypothetical protein